MPDDRRYNEGAGNSAMDAGGGGADVATSPQGVVHGHVLISIKEYESLLDDLRWRQCIEGAGVDNWSGFDDAMEDYHSEVVNETHK